MYVYENDAKKDKKPDLCRIRVSSVCTAVWRSWYDGTGGGRKDI